MGKHCMTPFSDFLERERLQRGLSKPEFAKLIGVSEKSLYRFTKDNPDEPRADTLVTIYQNLNVPLNELMELVHGTPPPVDSSAQTEFPDEDFEHLSEDDKRYVIDLIRRLRGRRK